MKYTIICLALVLLSNCTAIGDGIPRGAVAWCGTFEYTGTWLKTQNEGKALGVSDSAIAARMTVEDVIALAQAMNCGD